MAGLGRRGDGASMVSDWWGVVLQEWRPAVRSSRAVRRDLRSRGASRAVLGRGLRPLLDDENLRCVAGRQAIRHDSVGKDTACRADRGRERPSLNLGYLGVTP